MKTVLYNLQPVFRVAVSAIIGTQAGLALLQATTDPFSRHDITTAPLAQIGLNGLLLMVAIWLLLGIRTRVVAALGCVLLAAVTMTGGFILGSEQVGPILLIVAISLSIPLLVFGGGRWALYSGGWRHLL